MGLYHAKPTLAELYADDSTIFAGISLPSGLDLTILQPMLLQELGDLQTVFDKASDLASYLTTWSAIHTVPWTRMLTALSSSYNPIHNYDRTDTETESETTTDSTQGSASGIAQRGGSNSTLRQRQGFNSDTFVDVDKDTDTMGESNTTSAQTSASASGSRSKSRSLTSAGNIGVTTAMQMITAEVEMRVRLEMYQIVLCAFKRDLCVGVW